MSDQVARIRVEPARPERWEDVRAVLDDAAERGCWCQPWRGTDAEGRRLGESRPETLARHMRDDEVPPGFVAYLDDLPAGFRRVVETHAHSGRLPRILVRLDLA